MKFGYEDTDKKIEIELYDLKFDINNIDEKDIEELRKVDKDTETLEKLIDEFLGEGATKKINEKRVADGYKEMTLDIELAVLGCIFETYAKATTNKVFNRVDGTMRDINNRMNNYNRKSRRNYRRY